MSACQVESSMWEIVSKRRKSGRSCRSGRSVGVRWTTVPFQKAPALLSGSVCNRLGTLKHC